MHDDTAIHLTRAINRLAQAQEELLRQRLAPAPRAQFRKRLSWLLRRAAVLTKQAGALRRGYGALAGPPRRPPAARRPVDAAARPGIATSRITPAPRPHSDEEDG